MQEFTVHTRCPFTHDINNENLHVVGKITMVKVLSISDSCVKFIMFSVSV